MKFAVILLLTAAIFVYDLISPHGMSVSFLYLIPFILSGLYTGKRFSAIFGALVTALIIIGFVLDPPGSHTVISEANRALAILGGWGIFAVFMQRKDILKELAEANARLKAVFDSSPMAIVALDPDGNVLDWNRGAQDIFGYKAAEVIGRFYPLVEEDVDQFNKLLAMYREGKSMMGIEVLRQRKDGTKIPTLLSSAPLKDPEGNIIGVMGILIDLTEKKRTEAKINELNVEIAARKLLEREREEFAAMITHDLKSPLSAILGYADILLDKEVVAEQREKEEMLKVIRRNGDKMIWMIEDYLTVYKAGSGNLKLEAAPEKPADILRSIEEDFHAQAEKKGLKLESVIEGSPTAFIDKKLFSRAVSNLVQNAVKYTPSGGSVKITLEAGDNDFTVSVSDTGPGIQPEDQERIFQKHYRSSRDAGKKGAGLGLAIVKAVADVHGGRIILESAPGAGSTFRLKIPLRQR